MPTPKAGYRLADGSRVSGTTTIVSAQLAWNKQALMYWAWSQGRDGKDFREERDAAAALGTIVHSCIELEMRGGSWESVWTGASPPEPSFKSLVEPSMLAFWEWRDSYQLETTGSEVQLVSEKWRYGGTLDYPARVKGRRVILDLKTSGNVYPDHRIQLRAYGELWNENYPEDPVTGYHLLRVGKEDGGFAHHYWPSLEKEWECFRLLLELHRLAKELK